VLGLILYGAGNGTSTTVPLPVVSRVAQHGPAAAVTRMSLTVGLGVLIPCTTHFGSYCVIQVTAL
jgi:hypothetical protein